MSLSGAAAAMGLPESLVQRSAEARAAETGASVDEILAAWAGGEAAPGGAAPAEADPVASPAEPETVEVSDPGDEAGAEETDTAIIEPTPAPSPPADRPPSRPPTRAPAPAQVTAAQAAHLSEVITVPTAGIKERTNFVMPKWLTAILLFAPLLALFALGGSATGACGEGTELGVDVITGQIVNCDGSEFTGGGVGGGGSDPIALGGQIYAGSAVTGVNCAGCHGGNGQGAGTFPALTGVLNTFSSCLDHVEWVSLGSQGFIGRGDTTYGDINKPIARGMPAFGNTLTPEQLAAVTAFERVRFGGADPEATLVDCGLAEPEGEAETPTDEEGTTGTTLSDVEASVDGSG